MKWFDPSLRYGNYFQLKYLSYSVMKKIVRSDSECF